MLVVVLLVRFFVELALFAASAVAAASLVSDDLGSVILGVLGVVVTVALWSTLLSPKRPTHLPLQARVVIDLALFVLVAAGLWSAGYGWTGAILVGVDVLVLVALFSLGDEPGRHFDPREAKQQTE